MAERWTAKALAFAVAIRAIAITHPEHAATLAGELVSVLENADAPAAQQAEAIASAPPATAAAIASPPRPSPPGRALSMTANAIRKRRRYAEEVSRSRAAAAATSPQLLLPGSDAAMAPAIAAAIAERPSDLSDQEIKFQSPDPERGAAIAAAVPLDPPLEAVSVFTEVCETRGVELELVPVWAKFASYAARARKQRKLGWCWETTDQMLVQWRWWVGVERPWGTKPRAAPPPPASTTLPRASEPTAPLPPVADRLMKAGNFAGALLAAVAS